MREREEKERGEILNEDGREIGWMKEVWKRRERIEKERVSFIVVYRKKNGKLIRKVEEKLKRWVEYFDEVLNTDSYEEQVEDLEPQENNDQEAVQDPTQKEIEEEFDKLKNNKRTGENDIPGEIFKYEERMPQQWRNAVICPISEKENKTNCENYRGISLLNVTYKVLTRIIKKRLSLFHDTLIGEYQGGFRKDFKKSYDSIDRNILYQAMKKLKIPKKLIVLTRMTLTDTQNKISGDGRLSESFGGKFGVR
ncbi:uncharacterized protein [Tenebrio molitor]|uniref:uncharacterized protein n=1 Tax=Tenebrio molitor TaxID=7067 RepID=UPI003624A297